MSATGRSDVREESDAYITPSWAVHRFLEAYTLPQGATVLDPCAARGELLTAIHEVRPDLQLMAIEIRPECEPALLALEAAGVIQAHVIGDFTALPFDPKSVDAIVTNPPYVLAQAFVEAGIRVAKVSAHLLRINFLGGKKRRAFLAATKPGLFVIPNRPSFTGHGSDACEYAFYCFSDTKVEGTWVMLDLTPDTVVANWNSEARQRYQHLAKHATRADKEADAS